METSTLSWLKQILRRQELMDRVMEKCGVDVLAAIRADKGQVFFEARAKCRECPHDVACRDWWLESSEELQCLQISAPMPISSTRVRVKITL
jgi:Family of unknown function (DUF6455)